MSEDRTIDTVNNDYNEESDDDFDPQAAAAQPQEDSSDEDQDQATAKPRAKRSRPDDPQDEQDLDFDNSGDELTIKHGRKKKRKSGHESDADNDDEGGDGGFVRTRAQRKAEGTEKRALTDASQSKVDVNALWAAMSAPQPSKPSAEHSGTAAPAAPSDSPSTSQPVPAASAAASTTAANEPSEEMVTIKRKYDFAGQTIEEERRVPAASAEAKLYLEEQQRASAPKPSISRPRKRKTPFGAFAGNSSDLGATGPVLGTGKKLTTLEKSKLDWAAHVDKEGIADELDEASRAKGSYMGKVDFLGRMDAKRDDGLHRKP